MAQAITSDKLVKMLVESIVSEGSDIDAIFSDWCNDNEEEPTLDWAPEPEDYGMTNENFEFEADEDEGRPFHRGDHVLYGRRALVVTNNEAVIGGEPTITVCLEDDFNTPDEEKLSWELSADDVVCDY